MLSLAVHRQAGQNPPDAVGSCWLDTTDVANLELQRHALLDENRQPTLAVVTVRLASYANYPSPLPSATEALLSTAEARARRSGAKRPHVSVPQDPLALEP